jgi:uncharacterized membrane protein
MNGLETSINRPAVKKTDFDVLFMYALILAGSLVWVVAIFLAPYLRSRNSAVGALIYALFAPVCHQIPERSFYLFGRPLAVCGRCLGIYLGFLFGTLLYPLGGRLTRIRLPQLRTFLVMSAPIAADTAANFLRLWSSSNVLRLATGLLWGLLLPFYFIAGFAELASQRRLRKIQLKAHS